MTLSPSFAKKLARRRPLAVDPTRGIAIKRNQHEFVVGADAARFTEAFEKIMQEPGARFGAIEIKRLPGRAGAPFAVGERFTGCIKLAELGWPRLGRTRVGAWLEDAVFSDFAEIVERAPGRVVYRYLSGCPMAGSSTFTVEPIDSQRCRLRVVFEYQELGRLGVIVLNRFGLRIHDDVTRAQVERAAESLNAQILSSTLH